MTDDDIINNKLSLQVDAENDTYQHIAANLPPETYMALTLLGRVNEALEYAAYITSPFIKSLAYAQVASILISDSDYQIADSSVSNADNLLAEAIDTLPQIEDTSHFMAAATEIINIFQFLWDNDRYQNNTLNTKIIDLVRYRGHIELISKAILYLHSIGDDADADNLMQAAVDLLETERDRDKADHLRNSLCLLNTELDCLEPALGYAGTIHNKRIQAVAMANLTESLYRDKATNTTTIFNSAWEMARSLETLSDRCICYEALTQAILTMRMQSQSHNIKNIDTKGLTYEIISLYEKHKDNLELSVSLIKSIWNLDQKLGEKLTENLWNLTLEIVAGENIPIQTVINTTTWLAENNMCDWACSIITKLPIIIQAELYPKIVESYVNQGDWDKALSIVDIINKLKKSNNSLIMPVQSPFDYPDPEVYSLLLVIKAMAGLGIIDRAIKIADKVTNLQAKCEAFSYIAIECLQSDDSVLDEDRYYRAKEVLDLQFDYLS